MAEINGGKINMSNLFSQEFLFTIPEYQRPYKWRKEQVEQLYDDIIQANRDGEYFLGTIILQEIENIGTSKKYDIIDGQQRITTLQILLACLRDRVSDVTYKDIIQIKIFQNYNPVDGIPERVRLEVKEKDFFKKYVQIMDGTSKVSKEMEKCVINDTQRNIVNAINVLKEKILNLTMEQLKSLIQYINQRCVVMYLATKNFDDAFKLFVIINDRGLQLRRIDILKANNLEPTAILDLNDRIHYARIWESIEDDLGEEAFEKLIFFIRTIEVKEKAKEDILQEFTKYIFDKNKILKGKDFINYLYEYKEIYQKLLLDKDVFDKDEKNRKYSIYYKNYIYMMMSFLPSNDWVPPILYFYKKFGKDNLIDFLVKLEKKFVADWIIGLTPTKRILNINQILKNIETANDTNEILNSDVFLYDIDEYKKRLNEDIYNSDYVKYLLLRLEYIESEKNCERKYDTLSVEHVLPQTPEQNSKWVLDFDDKSRLSWTNKLANLILLGKRKNSSASNLDFELKKEKYFKNKITDLARSQDVMRYQAWNPKILEERQKKIICELLE